MLIQEKLDGIKTRYSDITATSSKALRTLEQARQLATKFQSTHEELNSWMSKVEEELASSGGQSPAGEQIPQFQQRQKVGSSDTECRGRGHEGCVGGELARFAQCLGRERGVGGLGAWGWEQGNPLLPGAELVAAESLCLWGSRPPPVPPRHSHICW